MWSMKTWEVALKAEKILIERVESLHLRLAESSDEATPALVLAHLLAIRESVELIEAAARSNLKTEAPDRHTK